MSGNLLKNPDGDDRLEHWELTESRGDEWRSEDMPGVCGHTYNDESITLLEEGYVPENVDIAQPALSVEDCQEVIDEFKPDEVILDPDCDDCSCRKGSHTFTDHGLHFISFEHGGQDTKYWQGWFGVRVGGIAMEPERAAKVIGACIVLHNLAMLWKMPLDDLGGEEIEEVPQEEHCRQFQDPEVQEAVLCLVCSLDGLYEGQADLPLMLALQCFQRKFLLRVGCRNCTARLILGLQ
ncbi:unnamed protein product [Leuciscus chuanchicus]